MGKLTKAQKAAEQFRRKTLRLMEQNRTAFEKVLARHRAYHTARFSRAALEAKP